MDEIESRILHSEGNTDVTYDETGSWIITGGGEGDIRLLECFDGDDITAQIGAGMVHALACRKGLIVVADDDCNVQALKLPKGEPDGTIARFSMPVYHVCFNSKGTWIAAGASDFEIKLVELSSNNQKVLRDHQAPILSLAFDPLDKYMSSASCDGTVRIWRLTEYTVTQMLNILSKSNDIDTAKSLCRLAWKPSDGKWIAIPVGTLVQFYERESWDLAFSLQHSQQHGTSDKETKIVNVVVWSPCGSYLASGTVGGDVTIWSISERTALKVFETEASPITALSWHPKDTELLYANTMGKVGLLKLQAVVSGQSLNEQGIETDDRYSAAALFDDDDDDQMNAFLDAEATEAQNYDDDDDDDVGISLVRRRPIIVAYDAAIDDDMDDEDDVVGDIDNREPANDSVLDASLLEVLKRDGAEKDAETNKESKSKKSDQVQVCRCPPPTEIQKSFQPGSTPEILTSRFMAYNLVGLVRQNNEDDLSTIDVEFHNASHHHSIHLSNHLSHTMASLSETAVLLACHSTDDVSSKLQCFHFGSWDTAKEWVCSMPNGENIEVISVSDRFAAVCTSLHFLRVFTITGIQRQVFSLPGPVVSLSTQGGLILVVYHQGQGLQGEQNLGCWLLDMDKQCRHLVLQQSLPLSPKSTLTWIGFMSSGMPVTYDSTGVVRVLHIACGNAWLPVANLRAHVKGKSDDYWIIGIHGYPPQIRCILCKGLTYPTTLPRPVATTLPLNIPVCEQSTEKGQLEEQCLQAGLFASSDCSGQIGVDKELTTVLMKMFALACKADREFRAIEIASLLPNSQTMGLAIKYASRMKRLSLAQRLDDIVRQQVEEEDEEEEDDWEIDGGEADFQSLAVKSRAGRAGNRILSSDIQREEAVTPGSFQAIQLIRQQEKAKQAQAMTTPDSCSESEEEEDERDKNVASPVSIKPMKQPGMRNLAAANPFKKAVCQTSEDKRDGSSSGLLESLTRSSPAAKKPHTGDHKRKKTGFAGEKENKEQTAKRPSRTKLLEADAFQLWINGNKESLEEQCGDVTEDAFYKQCASIFKKLAKEQKKEWIAKAKEQETAKEEGCISQCTQTNTLVYQRGGEKQMKKRGRIRSSTDAVKPNRQQQQTLTFFGQKKSSENEKKETEEMVTEESNDKPEEGDELESPVKKPKTETVTSKLSQFAYNRDD